MATNTNTETKVVKKLLRAFGVRYKAKIHLVKLKLKFESDGKPSKMFVCPECHCILKDARILEMHMRRKHRGEKYKDFKCEFCDYASVSSADLQRHRRTHTGDKPFACNLCPYQATVKDTLDNHLRIHTLEKPFNCPHCDFSSGWRTNLRSHLKACHTKGSRERKFSCQFCQMKYLYKHDVTVHMLTHTGETRFKCQYCDKGFHQRGNKDTHERACKKHPNYGDAAWLEFSRPFKCELCDYAAATTSALNNHSMKHTGNMKFKCSFCSYKCPTKGDLNYHIRKHTQEKPYNCSYCDFRCSLSGTLRDHEMRHRGDKPHKCPHCQRRCTTKAEVQNHVKHIHPS